MRKRCLVAGLLIVFSAAAPDAQQRDSTARDTVLNTRILPSEIEREVTDVFNSPGTLRASGALEIGADREVTSDVAVLNGPLTIAGRVSGRVVAINSDVILRPGARVEGEILVVGGEVRGKADAFIGGDIRVYRQALTYRRDGERLVASGSSEEDERWWRRRQRWHARSYSDLRLVSARTYNRVEGLPIYLGPSLRRNFDWGRIIIDAFGVVRTVDKFEWTSRNLGHSVKGEVKFGRHYGIAFGGRLFDVVDAVESWHLSDTEVGLASFFLHRDYRDYYDKHGGAIYGSIILGRDVDLTASLSDERWGSRFDRDPFTLFRNDQSWRPNPELDEGEFHVANATMRIDTRNDEDDPWSGWYITADYEHGTGRLTRLAATSPGVRAVVTGPVRYNRGFLDVRRYNRISPDAQLNLRVVAGGWLSGDELPLQRRLSVGGPGTVPGFDFRRAHGNVDVGQCGAAPSALVDPLPGSQTAPLGRPAECERVLLAQVEYRGDLYLDLFGGWDDWHGEHWPRGMEWVVFADAGRGWLVGPRSGEIQYPKGVVPPLSTFQTDVGVGLELGSVGVYVAKAVSESKAPANFFVRIKRRF